MIKDIDIKNRLVNLHEVDTGLHENEIISYLDRQMKVAFHGAYFNNKKYVFTGNPNDKISNAIVVSGYRLKRAGERISVDIG